MRGRRVYCCVVDTVWEGEGGGGERKTNLVGEFGDDGLVWRLDPHHQHEPLHTHTHIHNISTGVSTPIFSLVPRLPCMLRLEHKMPFEWPVSA
jgi:hypothetical protein